MGKGRLEAFSDGVLAIIITIMVLELRVPHGADLAALRPLVPVLLSYVLSFVYVGIYWNNHHHMLAATHKVNGRILWANLHLLFWLSLVPFATGWMGENHFAALPVAGYGVVLIMAALAYTFLARSLVSYHGEDSALARALGKDFKGNVSLLVYATALPCAFVDPRISMACYILVAILWFIPDRRIERVLPPE
ncbi:MAG TPA: TMEM175 family protein [Thermoanaerobaculia bacterium]|nr:TMEM175 family protein [Thermoanaerobaculia bacterium]